MKSEKLNVKIIGGGPAGLVTGLRLVKDHDVVIYEKDDKIESSPCAEGISIASLTKLEKETRFDSSPYISRKIDGFKFIFPNGKKGFIHQKGAVLNRDEWEHAMAKEFIEGGGRLITGERIGSLSEVSGDIKIGADGAFSVTREEIDGEVRKDPVFFAMNVPHDSSDFDYVRFYFDKTISPYYLWLFPKKGGVNIGGYFEKGVFELARREGVNLREKDLNKWVDSVGGTKFQKNNVFLVGDSGSTTNPFTGGGLGPIVHASKFLSDSINEEKFDKYQVKVKNSLVREEYFEAEKVLKELDNEELKKVGDIVDGGDPLSLPVTKRIKSLTKPFLSKKMHRLKKGLEKAIKYW